MSWHYEKAPLNGGAPGDAYKSVFNGSGKNEAANLAREAIQNSVDAAADPGGAVRVDFRFRRMQGEARRAFETAASLTDIALREPDLGLPKSNGFRDQVRPLDVLYVDDYDTTGLKGDPTHPSSNLRKLLMDLGGSGKAQNQEDPTGSARPYTAQTRASARSSRSAGRKMPEVRRSAFSWGAPTRQGTSSRASLSPVAPFSGPRRVNPGAKWVSESVE